MAFHFNCSAKMLKTFSGSRKSSPHRTPVKKQIKVPSLLDPSRLRPPPPMIGSVGSVGSGINSLSTNTRINYGLSMQQQNDSSESTQSTQNVTLQLDEDEIMTISPDSKIV